MSYSEKFIFMRTWTKFKTMWRIVVNIFMQISFRGLKKNEYDHALFLYLRKALPWILLIQRLKNIDWAKYGKYDSTWTVCFLLKMFFPPNGKCMKLINKKLIDAGKVFFLSDIVQYLPLWFNSEIRIFVSGPLTDFSIININMAFHIHLYIVRAGQGLVIRAYDAQPGCLQTRCCLHTNNYHSSDL